MSQKKNLKPPGKIYLVAGILICMSLFALSVKAAPVVSPLKNVVSFTVTPIQSGIMNIGEWVTEHISFIGTFINAKAENDKLQAEIEALNKQVNQLEKNQEELERLRKLLELAEEYSEYPVVGARVIGKGPGNWFDTLVINKGEKDGMEEGMNVLSGDGLVGVIVEVQSRSSKVMSIIDDESNVSAMSSSANDICIVKGSETTIEEGYIEVEDIEKDAKIKEGDKIVTSNISSKYLPELTIGTIKDIKLSDNKLTKTAKLEPAVDFDHLQEVLVITEQKSDWTSTESDSKDSKKDKESNTDTDSDSDDKNNTGTDSDSDDKNNTGSESGSDDENDTGSESDSDDGDDAGSESGSDDGDDSEYDYDSEYDEY